ncbi:transposable element Tcb2 transposase [Trichonephila clavipes]|nr:transposable element Tcb2 transposase [Trichonephila clavipes]
MNWTARSPDLNPIEHVWNTLRRAIATRNLPPRTNLEMYTALLNGWGQLSQELINCLISKDELDVGIYLQMESVYDEHCFVRTIGATLSC